MKLKKILYILFVLFAAYVIVELIRKIFGGSLTYDELIVTLLLANLGYSYKLNEKVSGHLGWHKGQETK